jgi:uncharacterized protein (DUF58 family)
MGAHRVSVSRSAVTAGLGGLLILIALLFDAVPLFVCGVAALLIAVVTPVWVWAGLAGSRVERRLPAERIVEDQPLDYSLEVRRGWLAPPAAEVSDPFAGLQHPLAGGPLIGQRIARVDVRTQLRRRGLHRLPPPYLSSRDPLGLVSGRRTAGHEGQRLLVLPRTEPVHWAAGGLHRLGAPEASSASEARASVDFDGLRPYRVGTPASRIYWPALARGAGLVERRLLADGEARPLVVLDARQTTLRDQDALDAAVRAAASLVLELARSGGCALLLPGDHRPVSIDPELARWPGTHDRLALVEAPQATAPALGVLAARGGPFIYVSAELPEPLTRIDARAGRGTCLLVVPRAALLRSAQQDRRLRAPVALEVAGCRGFVLSGSRSRADAARAPEAVSP